MKIKEKLKWLKWKIHHKLSHHCPECNGVMKTECFDMKLDKLVYKCTVCGKEYI